MRRETPRQTDSMSGSSVPSAFERKLRTLSDNSIPTRCHWDLTYRCNASCAYCFVKGRDLESDLSTPQALAATDALRKSGVLAVTLSGGEPFLRSDILQILTCLIENDIFWISILTNATIVDSQHIDFLCRHADCVQNVQVSMYSHVSSVNDTYFGVSSALKKQLEVCRLLAYSGIRVKVALNLFEFNIDTSAQTKAFLEDKGFEVSLPYQKIPCGDGSCAADDCVTTQFYKRLFESTKWDPREKMDRAVHRRHDQRFLNSFPCNGLFNSIYLAPNGGIHPCGVLREPSLGSILGNSSIQQILSNSDLYRALRSVRNDSFRKCRGCQYFGFCFQCLGLNRARTGSHLTPAPQTCRFAEAAAELSRVSS